MQSSNDFDVDAAVAAITFIAERIPNLGAHQLAKILYFAEREHLSRYGRFIIGDEYIRMEHGPVPSKVYDGLKYAANPAEEKYERILGEATARAFAESLTVDRGHRRIRAAAHPDLDNLSVSDLECLEWSIENYRELGFGERSRKSHVFAWSQAPWNGKMSVVDIAAENDAPEEVMDFLRSQYPS